MALKYPVVAALYEKMREEKKISRSSLRLFSVALTKIYETHCALAGCVELERLEELLQVFDCREAAENERVGVTPAEVIVNVTLPEGADFRVICIQSGRFLRGARSYDRRLHLMLGPEDTGLGRNLFVDAAEYASLRGSCRVGVEVGMGNPGLRFETFSLENLDQYGPESLNPEIRGFLESNAKAFQGGLFYNDSLEGQAQDIKNLLDARAREFLGDYMSFFLEDCYRQLRKSHGYKATMDFMAKIVTELYENENLEWLRDRNDLYGFRLYDVYNPGLLNMATAYFSKEEARSACQEFFNGEFDSDGFASFDAPEASYVRFDNVDLVRRIVAQVENDGRVYFVCNSRGMAELMEMPEKMWRLADDVIQYYEVERFSSDCHPFLFRSGKFYMDSLLHGGMPMVDIFGSQACPLYYREADEKILSAGHARKILIVDESRTRCWPMFELAAKQLQEHARANDLHVLWFRHLDRQEAASLREGNVPEVINVF